MTKTATLTFPHIELTARDGHKLRGYFGNLFREHSPLLHNHLEGGGLRYAYPMVQYKVVHNTPTLLGFNEGAQLLVDLFLQINELQIADQRYAVEHKDLRCREVVVGYSEDLHTYVFRTPYLALNQDNYATYRELPEAKRPAYHNRLLRNHILAAFKGLDVWLGDHERIMVQSELRPTTTRFKNQRMLAFRGTFTTNALLPRFVGLGKSVSRGLGTVEQLLRR